MTLHQEKTLFAQLKNDIKSSLQESLSAMTREEHKNLSWFCSEEQKMLEVKQAA